MKLDGMKIAVIGSNEPAMRAIGGALEREGATIRPLPQSSSDAFDAVIVAGGKFDGAETLLRKAVEDNKAMAVFGDGASLLAAAELLRGRTLSAPAELHDTIAAAGGTSIDQSVWIDQRWLTAREVSEDALNKLIELFAVAYEAVRIDPAPASS